MQAPRRIDDDDIIRARLGGGNRIVDYRRRIGAGFLLDDLDADALRPDFQLLDRGGAKRVRGAKHDALSFLAKPVCELPDAGDRKSTRLNSSHRCISYAVFCLKKKKKI